MISRYTRFLLLLIVGMLAAAVGVSLLCLLPGYLMDSGHRNCLRWLQSPANQETLREVAASLLRDYPEGTSTFELGLLPLNRTPDLIQSIPPPASGWRVRIATGDKATDGHIVMLSLGGFASYALHVGDTNFVMVGAKRIAPGIYLRSGG